MTAPAADEPPRQAPPEPPAGDGPDGVEEATPGAPEAQPAPRRRLFRRRPLELPGAGADGAPAPAPGALRRRRRQLTQQRQEAVYHLGGLAFELYRREQLPAGVMRRRAAEVAEIDRTVGEIDALLEEIDRARRERREAGGRKIGRPAEIGCCLRCRAGFTSEARFCWRCGVAVVPAPETSDEVTEVISSEDRGRR